MADEAHVPAGETSAKRRILFDSSSSYILVSKIKSQEMRAHSQYPGQYDVVFLNKVWMMKVSCTDHTPGGGGGRREFYNLLPWVPVQ